MNLRKLIAQTLSLGLLHLSLVSGNNLQAASIKPDLKQRIEQFGVGTELKLKLDNGETLRGSVESIGRDSFVVVSNAAAIPREIPFASLENVRYPKRGYTANGAPDPAGAKRMIVQLGVGEHVMVKVSPTEKVRGHIHEIQDDHVVILPDGKTATLNVPYGSVWKVNKNLSFGATLAIIVGIAAAAVLILVLSDEEEIDVI